MLTAPDLHLPHRAENLHLSNEGLWVASGDVDLRFLAEDSTDWVKIEDCSFWYQHRNNVILDMLARFPYRGWLFEVGAGNGAVGSAIQQAGLPVVAIEPTVSWARNSQRRGLKHVICAHLERAEFLAGALDNVAMFDVLEHIADDRTFLRQLRPLIPTGGRLYLAVPAYQALWSHEDELSGHHRRYNASKLHQVVREAGFQLEFSSYFFAPLIPAIFSARSLPYRLGLSRGRTHTSSAADHGLKDTRAVRFLRTMLNRERSFLKRNGSLAMGSSLFAVAVAAE
jgi:SAM-dependent methyltransferase